jgi:chromosome segregation ATPase
MPYTTFFTPDHFIMTTTSALFATEGIDAKSLEFLVQAIEKNNLPGFDYLEFKRAIFQLKNMNLDESTAHKSAFATAATLGITKEKLIETAGYYRNLVEKEREHFAQALEHQNNTKVFGKEQEIKRLKDQIERHKIEIARLQDEIAGYLNQVSSAEETVKQESEKLDKARTAFEKAHQWVLLAIDKDVEQMHKHLG